jgi:acyl-CoA thioesterase II
MTDPVTRLLDMLELEPAGTDRFRTDNPDPGYASRVFGGQVAAQAVRAVASTVDDDRACHSLHAYFVRPGRPGTPILFEVERTRDGRSFTTRRVVAAQGEEIIFEMSASFHRNEPGVDYQLPPSEGVPLPDEAPPRRPLVPKEALERMPVELRELDVDEPDERGWYPSTRRVWMRTKSRLPDDALVHQCVLAFLSDMGAVLGARAPLPEQPLGRLMGASLDHALWFHRPMRADEWLLYDLHAVSNAGSRGLACGAMHSIDGRLGVSVAQEALIRVVDPDRRPRS